MKLWSDNIIPVKFSQKNIFQFFISDEELMAVKESPQWGTTITDDDVTLKLTLSQIFLHPVESLPATSLVNM